MFELGKNHHNRVNLYSKTEEAYRMYEGDQWYGSGAESERLPMFNIITPTVEYKTAMISKQNIQIIYNPHVSSTPEVEKICETLNKFAMRKWEQQKLDYRLWDVVKAGCVAGDSYLYFYNKNLDCQIIDNTSIYFADEQNPDIQQQEYIILFERRPVAKVRREAKENGVSKADIELIVADDETDTTVGDTNEVNNDAESGKCSCLVYFTRDENGNIQFCRSTQNVVYQPMKTVTGMRRYPIAAFVWTPKKNSSRGVGEVCPMIPNQIEINKLLARRLISAKQNAFAKPVYVENMIENPADITKIGEAIKIKQGNVSDINNIFGYKAPAPMSQEAPLLQDSMINLTRNLASAGDAALGNVNPERASGAAILAIQDQNAIPLNEQVAAYKQFVEDIALIWFDMWKAYYRNKDATVTTVIEIIDPLTGKQVRMMREDTIKAGDLNDLEIDVKIDATPTSPFSLYAQEQALAGALQQQLISFAEYVDALPDNSNAPKQKYRELLRKRATSPQMQLPGAEQTTPGNNIPASQGGVTPVTPMSIPTASVMPTK